MKQNGRKGKGLLWGKGGGTLRGEVAGAYILHSRNPQCRISFRTDGGAKIKGMDNILIGPALTVAGGLVIYGATQLAQRFWLNSVTELMKSLG